MKALKILTTAAVAGALVATAVAGPASAADILQTVQPTIITNVPSVVVPAYTESAPITVNTSALGETDVTGWVTHNGATFNTGTVYQDSTGNASYDVLAKISSSVFAYGDVEPGDYSVYFTSAQIDDRSYAYPDDTVTTYLAAQSASVSVHVDKLTSSITGFKTKTRVAKYNKSKLFVTIGKPTVINAGANGRAYVEYKTSKKGKWHTATTSAITIFSSDKYSYKLPYGKFNSVKKGKIMKRGTYYLRVVVKPSAFVTGATSKTVKIKVK